MPIVNSEGSVVATATTEATDFYFFTTMGFLTTGSTFTVQVTSPSPKEIRKKQINKTTVGVTW